MRANEIWSAAFPANANWQEPGVRFVIMRDDDNADCRDLKARRANLCVQGGRSDAWVRIVCQELEVWHLGEPDALAAVYGNEPLRDLRARRAIANRTRWRIPPKKGDASFRDLAKSTARAVWLKR